jgi:pimeloyl-ACP methyl ester carboxylesterase
MPTISVDQHTIHYQAQGTGPDVLMIHGWASSLRMWERSVRVAVSAGYRAWALDLPGHGESSAPASEQWYTIPHLASAVEAFLQHVGIQRAVIVGHSMGGAIALELTARCPQRVRGLVLAPPVVTGRIGLSLHLLFDSPMGRRMLTLSQHHNTLARLGELSAYGLSWLRGGLGAALRRDAQDLARTAPQAAAGCLNAVLNFDFTDRLATIRAPTLVFVGLQDITLPPSDGMLAAAGIPGARLVKMPGVAHHPMDERPEEFDRLLIEFLKDLRG